MDNLNSKKTIYRLDDGMFRFWYRFVYPNLSLISIDKGDMVYDRIKSQIPDFMGEVFESICIEYMWDIYETLTVPFQNIGRWWGNNPVMKSQIVIDFIAYNDTNDEAILGECKWRNELLDKGIVDSLVNKSKMFSQFTNKFYYFFSKTGFTNEVLDYAKKNKNIQLVSLSDMFE